jgi:hypothetical protein
MVKPVTSSYFIARHTNGTLQAAIAEKVFLPGKHGYDHARQARNLLAGQRPVAVLSAAGVSCATDSARAQGMRIPPKGPGNGSSPLAPLEDPMPPRVARMRRGEYEPAAHTDRAEAGKRIFRHDPALLLFVPLHVAIRGVADGPAGPAFGKPGSPFASFTNRAIAEVGAKNQKMAAPLSRLGTEAPARLLRLRP